MLFTVAFHANPAHNLTRSSEYILRWTTALEALEMCKSRARAVRDGTDLNGGNVHINVVPLVAPPLVAHSSGAPISINADVAVFYNGDHVSTNVDEALNIPWGVGNCHAGCLANEPNGSKVCYPLRVYGKRANAEQEWTTSPDDPEDEIFYSTCYVNTPSRIFDDVTCSATQCLPATLGGWRFGDRCAPCEIAEHNKDPRVVPHWVVAPVGSCSECELPLLGGRVFDVPSPAQPQNGFVSPDEGLTMTYVRTTGSTDSITCTVRCDGCDPDGWVAVGISPASGMVGTDAVRWRLDTGVVDEVTITDRAAGGVATASGGANLRSVTTDVATKTLTFTASALGSKAIATAGVQVWAWAYSSLASPFAQHSGASRGVATLDFNLAVNTTGVWSPTAPPTFNDAPSNSNGRNAPVYRITTKLRFSELTSVAQFNDNVKVSFISKVAAKLVVAESAITVLEVTLAARRRLAATPRQRRHLLSSGVEVKFVVAVEAVDAGGASGVQSDLATFVTDTSSSGLVSVLQAAAPAGTTIGRATVTESSVVADAAPTTAPTLAATAPPEDLPKTAASTRVLLVALLAASFAALLGAIIVAVAAIVVLALIIRRLRSSSQVRGNPVPNGKMLSSTSTRLTSTLWRRKKHGGGAKPR